MSTGSRQPTRAAGGPTGPAARRVIRASAWLAVTAFVWQLLYLPVHVLLECHDDHRPGPTRPEVRAAARAGSDVAVDDHCRRSHGGGHVPHCVRDHALPTVAQTPTSPLNVAVAPPAAPAVAPAAGNLAAASVFDRCPPPGRPPPGPSLPRAPPHA